MNIEKIINDMTPDVFERLCYAAETGRWPNGEKLADEQKQNVQQLVMLYQSKWNVCPQHMTISQGGEIHLKSKSELRRNFENNEHLIIQKKLGD